MLSNTRLAVFILLALVSIILCPSFGRAATYTYDSLNRLIYIVNDDGKIVEYTYDAVGNRIEKGQIFTITANSGSKGSILPAGASTVYSSTNQTYTITPNTGYYISDVQVDGVSVGAVTSYTFSNVTANHTISATFTINTYTVTPSAGTNGSISPSTPQTVNYNATTSFTVIPNTGYIASVTGCGGTLSGNTYTTGAITSNCTVAATFGFYTISTNTTLSAGTYTYGTLWVTNGATLTLQGNTTTGTGVIINATNIIVDAGASISADGQGYAGTYTSAGGVPSDAGPGGGYYCPGTGQQAGSYGGEGGAGRGGCGGMNTNTYGSVTQPVSLGSSAAAPTAGGGAIKLVVSGTTTINGNLSANGQPLTQGGGSGGSIWINTATLAGSGTISANGGDSGNWAGGGGGGGRIALYSTTSIFSGSVTVNGGAGGSAASSGTVGTIYENNNGVFNCFSNMASIDASTLTGLTGFDMSNGCTLTMTNNLSVSGNIHIASGGTLIMKANTSTGIGNVITASNIIVDSGGSLNADGQGYAGTYTSAGGVPSDAGPGGGYYCPGTGQQAGSYGGEGGAGRGGCGGMNTNTYGSVTQPVSLGSSAAGPTEGGGAIKLVVSGTTTINGNLSANGQPLTQGGGSGGSIWINTATLAGSGTISANGGDSGNWAGGGGGGGRIALYSTTSIFSGSVTVNGGAGGSAASSGTAGTVYYENTYTVTPSAGANGIISPSTTQTVNKNATTSFTVTPNTGYLIASVTGCGGTLSGNTYTTGAVTSNCTVTATFTAMTYTITATAGSNGSITPSGAATVNSGGSQTYTITPNTGYQISDVQVDGVSVGVVSTYIFSNVTANHTIAAAFTNNAYTVTPSADTNGTISPATPQSVNYGNTASFTVTPNSGYVISSVSGCGGTLVNNTYTTGAITSDCTVSATFSVNTYTITVSQGLNGTIAPSTSIVNAGDDLIFTVTPAQHYHVTSVVVDGADQGPLSSYSFTKIAGPHTITATYSIDQVTLTVQKTGTGTGSVTSTPSGIDCGNTCSTTFNYGTPVTISGAASNNSIFNGWSGGCSGTGTCSVTLTDNTIITADFEAPQISVTPSSTDFGSVNMAQSSAAQAFTITNNGGAPLTISGAALTGPNTTDFSVTSDSCSNATLQFNRTCEVDVVFNPATAGIKFAKVTVSSNDPSTPTFDITLNGTGVQTYTITPSAGNGGSISPSTAQTVTNGATMSFTVTANSGYSVSSVSGCGGSLTGNTYTTGSITSDCAVIASFAVTTYSIASSAGSNGSISPNGSTSVNYGDSQSYTITPASGYHVADVQVDGTSVSAVTGYTFSNVTANHTINATFSKNTSNTFTITLVPGANGTITGATTVNYGDNQTYTITPNTGYQISNVTLDGVSQGAVSSVVLLNITANHTIKATFTIKTYSVTPSAGANGIISPSTAKTVKYNATTSFTVKPDTGYQIQSATGCGGTLSGGTYTTGPVTGDCTVSATFVAKTYTVTPSAGANGSINPSTAQAVSYKGTASFAVTPDTGYDIKSVKGCGGTLSGSTYTTGLVTADCTVSATFVAKTYTVTPSAGANGSIGQSTPKTVKYNATTSFTVMADIGYQIESVTGCGGALSGNKYTTGPVTGDCTVSATFTAKNYTVTPIAGSDGSITPSSAQTVAYKGTTSFTIASDTGYQIKSVSGCKGTLSGSTYTTGPITGNCTVAASFTAQTYVVTPSAGANGSISPSAAKTVKYNATTTFTVKPDTGYQIQSVTGCGGTLSGSTYTTGPVTGDCTVAASYTTKTYTVTPSAGANGSINPSTAQTVSYKGTTSFNVTPDTGHDIKSVKGCGGTLSGNTYTTGPVTADCTVSATFTLNAYTITASAGANGGITPSGATTVNSGGSQTYTITPNSNYHIADVQVDGTSVGAVSSYTFSNVTANHTISATFAINTYAVTPSAGTGGSISPSASQTVSYNGTVSFTVTPNAGYSIGSVTGCGGTLSGNTYTTGPITSACTVTASFTITTYTITATAGSNGSITPSGAATVNSGGSQTYTITPNTGYQISDVQVDGLSVGVVSTYTFSNVTANHTIAATFANNTYTVTPLADTNGTISPSAPQAVNYGNTASFMVTPNSGYVISSVSGCGGTLVNNTYTTGAITSDCTVSATFSVYT
ncbi:MAG: choice-of-anchor D domain-containing protein, partial [Nitrospirae bacterium]|nr:choice-of-anchor D domain-containing protein [Nitrospirota bacterium]